MGSWVEKLRAGRRPESDGNHGMEQEVRACAGQTQTRAEKENEQDKGKNITKFPKQLFGIIDSAEI
jgi:hypothetical protein